MHVLYSISLPCTAFDKECFKRVKVSSGKLLTTNMNESAWPCIAKLKASMPLSSTPKSPRKVGNHKILTGWPFRYNECYQGVKVSLTQNF